MSSTKIIASFVALAMAVMALPVLAQTTSAADLAAQIQALQAQLASLQGQLGTTATGGTT